MSFAASVTMPAGSDWRVRSNSVADRAVEVPVQGQQLGLHFGLHGVEVRRLLCYTDR